MIVVASVRPRRVGRTIADWFVHEAAARPEFETDVVDLRELDLPVDLEPTSNAEAFASSIGRADAIVVVTPEYNHGYPASLKVALDTVKYEWRSKPIGFVSYGGLSGGMRATEQLRQVAVELHMVPVRDSVSLHRVRALLDGEGPSADKIAMDSSTRMLDQLQWWAVAARTAAELSPYPSGRRRGQ